MVGRLARILVLAAVGGGALVGGYWWFAVRPRLAEIEGRAPVARSESTTVDVATGALAAADRSVTLEVDPMGIAWDGRALHLGTRAGGLVRIVPSGDEWTVERVPVLEPAYGQNVAFDSLAWNGTHLVGLAMGSWFQLEAPQVLVVLDPRTLAPGRIVPIGDDVGAVAWDGSSYWLGTRKDTPDEDVPAVLRRLDPDFAEIEVIPAPAGGCQGLAWDGRQLWWADVFDDALLRIDPSGSEARVLGRHDVGLTYLSGVGWDGRALWVGEYGDRGLHRIAPSVLAGWAGGSVGSMTLEETAVTPAPERAEPVSDADADALLATVREGSFGAAGAAVALQASGRGDEARGILRDLLWSEDTFQRMHAERALEAMGLPADRARRVETSPETGPTDTDLLDLRAWFEGDELHADWRVHVGEELVAGTQRAQPEGVFSMPTFAKYQLDVSGGTLAQELEREYDAVPGLNAPGDQVLATGLGPGEYQVSVFIHVQHVAADGSNQILNDSAGFVTVQR